MFPISDDKPSARFPITVILIVIANVFVFWKELSFPELDLHAFVESFGMIPKRDFG